MLQRKLKEHLEKNLPFLFEKKLLLAVSGGVDSMVLFHLFHELGFEIQVAHCNFQLRGEDSILDKLFVEKTCKKLTVPFHSIDFETEKIAKKEKQSIQLIARKLRYDWFYQILEKENLDYILTAHHLDDSIETFLINLSRGTGLKGLTGIPSVNEKVVRPLLHFTKEEMKNHAIENDLEWREDLSNQKLVYTRNKIRHQILPHLTQLHPDFYENFKQTQTILSENQEIIASYIKKVKSELIQIKGKKIHLSVSELLAQKPLNTILYHVFFDFGLNYLEEIKKFIYSKTGSIIRTRTHILLKNREELIIKSLEECIDKKEYTIPFEQEVFELTAHIKLQFNKSNKQEKNASVSLDFDKIKLPLKIKKWESGDFFYPLGIKGKKKVSKFFKDERLSIFEKNETWLLCDATNSILWIIGCRMDERYKITDKTQTILNIKLC